MVRPANNFVFGTMLLLASFAVFAVLLFGGAQLVGQASEATGNGGGGSGGPATPGGPVNLTIVGKALKFDLRTISASPGASVTITLDNQDAGVLHNIAFYTNTRATEALPGAKGELFPGIAERTMTFTAPSRTGTFFFRCDVHPDTMTGSFIVR